MRNPIDIFIHLDKYLYILIQQYGNLTYLILFLVIFLETGFVLTPFLPGDSLLFVVGTFATAKLLNITFLFVILAAAAILGDSVNFWVGKYFGEKVFANSRFFKQEYLEKTKEFYQKHGGKTIIFARFIPIIRTFAPFVAGIGKMNYPKFLIFNVASGVSWVGLFLFGGYFFGSISLVQENLTLVTIVIISTSFIPVIIEVIKRKRMKTN